VLRPGKEFLILILMQMKRIWMLLAIFALVATLSPSCSDSNDDPQGEEPVTPPTPPGGPALTMTIRDVTSSTFSADIARRSDFKDNYYVGVIGKDFVDGELSGYSDSEKAMYVALSFVKNAIEVQGLDLGMIDNFYIFGDDARIDDIGRMWPIYADTEYYVIAFGLAADGTITSDVAFETVRLLPARASSNVISFSVDVKNEWEAVADVTTTTSDFYYVDYCEKEVFDNWMRNGMTETELADAILQEIKDSGNNWRLYTMSGNQNLELKNGMIYPGTEYVLFAFGIDGGSLRSTTLVKNEFRTDGDPLVLVDPKVSTEEFGTIRLSNPSATSMDLTVEPLDPEMPYYVNWGTVADFQVAGALVSDQALLEYDRGYFEALRIAWSNLNGIDYKLFVIMQDVCQRGRLSRSIGGGDLPLDSGMEQMVYAYGLDPTSGRVLTKIEKAYLSTLPGEAASSSAKRTESKTDVRALLHKGVNCVELPAASKTELPLTRFTNSECRGRRATLR